MIKNFTGIGVQTSKLICKRFGINLFSRLESIDLGLKLKLLNFLKLNYTKDPKLIRKERIDFFIRTNHIKGLRFQSGLPLNLQKTKNNAKTRKKFKIY